MLICSAIPLRQAPITTLDMSSSISMAEFSLALRRSSLAMSVTSESWKISSASPAMPPPI